MASSWSIWRPDIMFIDEIILIFWYLETSLKLNNPMMWCFIDVNCELFILFGGDNEQLFFLIKVETIDNYLSLFEKVNSIKFVY